MGFHSVGVMCRWQQLLLSLIGVPAQVGVTSSCRGVFLESALFKKNQLPSFLAPPTFFSPLWLL